ncbi:hypothetical protein LCGC14_1089220 [marine sediment metagenome]|uniref:Uncharacterized protein n=1 Tax=marine sediment metagenome TaxID=412755 RepID=A0A0F9PW00_9ZZZZ
MRYLLVISILLVSLFTMNVLFHPLRATTVCYPQDGCTGTSTAPSSGQILIGAGSVYAPAYLTAGSNITISTSSGAITINATVGANYWTLSGTNLHPTSTTYKVGIGTTTPQTAFHLVGTPRWDLGSDATSDVFYRNSSGNLDRLAIGADGTIFTASSTAPGGLSWEAAAASGATIELDNLGTVAINTSLISDTDSTDDLGSSGVAWANLYVDSIYWGSTSLPRMYQSGLTLRLDGNRSDNQRVFNIRNDASTSYNTILLISGRNNGSFGIDIEGTASTQVDFDFNQLSRLRMDATVYPKTDSADDLGRSTEFWDETFTDELVLQNVGAGATAANQTRLSGKDLSAGDAGLHIKTEDDTEHLFASLVGIGTTTPAYTLQMVDTASTTLAIGSPILTGCIVMGDSDGAGITYVTALNGVLTATTTQPSICQ